jgi:hypothetical protein
MFKSSRIKLGLVGAFFFKVLVETFWMCGKKDSYLVDPASSHMLVSKIKPCMSKYKQIYTVKLRMAHYISYSLFEGPCYLDNRSNSRANTCIKPRLLEGVYLLDGNQCGATR